MTNSTYSFPKKVIIAASIGFLFLTIFLVLKASFNVILLVLAGVLIAVYFRGLSYWISEKWGWSEKLSLVVVIGGTVLVMVLLGWLLGAKIQSQMSQLSEQLPTSSQEFKTQLSKYKWGRQLLNNSEGFQKKFGSSQKVFKGIRNFFKTTFGVLGDIYVILFIGLFFTASPHLYKSGIVVLIPPDKRQRGEEIVNKVGYTLRSWLIGKLLAMIIVAILTGVSLLILGIPMALALGLIAGLLNFIPNFGPILGLIPAFLVALSQGTTKALIVVVIFIAIQVVESNFITPLIQKRLIEIPPAYIIIAQVLMGILTGGLGIILATPVIAILMVLIQELYIKPLEQK